MRAAIDYQNEFWSMVYKLCDRLLSLLVVGVDNHCGCAHRHSSMEVEGVCSEAQLPVCHRWLVDCEHCQHTFQ